MVTKHALVDSSDYITEQSGLRMNVNSTGAQLQQSAPEQLLETGAETASVAE